MNVSMAYGAHVIQFAGYKNASALWPTGAKGVLFQSIVWSFSASQADFVELILNVCIILSVASICGITLSHN